MKSIVRILAVTAAVVTLGAFAASDDDLLSDLEDSASATSSDSDEAGEAVSDETETKGEVAADEDGVDTNIGEGGQAIQIKDKLYHIIPFCRMLEGQAEALIPGAKDWQRIDEGKYYPLGTIYRTVGGESRLTIMFGPNATVEIVGEASFSTRAQPLDEKSRSIGLVSGRITVKLPSALKEGLFSVTAPGFTVKNMAGESRFTYVKTGDGDEAIVRCVTQSLMVEGPHFSAPAMRAANEIRIRTAQDRLMTALYGSRGDIMIHLYQGLVGTKDFATGETKIEPKYLDWKLSPKTSIRIHRAMPAVGKRMSVTTMTFDERGQLRNRRAFTEEMMEVNSGELGPMSKKEREAMLRRAKEELDRSQGAKDAAAETQEEEASDAEDSKGSDSDSDELEM